VLLLDVLIVVFATVGFCATDGASEDPFDRSSSLGLIPFRFLHVQALTPVLRQQLVLPVHNPLLHRGCRQLNRVFSFRVSFTLFCLSDNAWSFCSVEDIVCLQLPRHFLLDRSRLYPWLLSRPHLAVFQNQLLLFCHPLLCPHKISHG